MAIYPPEAPPFHCLICGKRQPDVSSFRWSTPEQRDRPPLCYGCEQDWSIGVYGDRNPDRRVARQISAIAAALEYEAALQLYHGKIPHG